MKKIAKLFENKRNLVSLGLLASLIFTTYKIQENSGRIKRLTNFESGVQTCFSRVNQSYTAKMIGDTDSNYLSKGFQNLTEECFAEGILNVDDNFQLELIPVAKKLSMLASNVHWFHEDLAIANNNGNSRSLVGDTGAVDTGARFEKIEATKDEILDATDVYKNEISNSLNQQKSYFYVASVFLILLMVSEYISSSRKRLLNKSKEKEAEAELANNNGVNSVKIGEIIRVALEQNDLANCSKLFLNYHTHHLMSKTNKNKGRGIDLESLVTPLASVTAAKLNDKIDKIWNDDRLGVVADVEPLQTIKTHDEQNLEVWSSKVIDLLSEKMFSHGIKVDINIPEGLMIKSSPEELEQILYHLFNYAINATGVSSRSRSLSIVAHRLGGVVAFDLVHSGEGFDQEILKSRLGISDSGKKVNIDLEICLSLLQEIDAKAQLDNKIDQSGAISGGRIKIIFKSGEQKAKLVDLKVGSKKEILASMNSASVQ